MFACSQMRLHASIIRVREHCVRTQCQGTVGCTGIRCLLRPGVGVQGRGVGERPWLHSGLALRPAGLRGAIHLCNPRRWDCRALVSPARSARPACSPLLSPRPPPSPWKESLQLPTPCFSEIKNVCPLRTAGRVRGGPEVSWGGWCAQPDMPAAACFPSSRGTRELILVPRELPSAARLGSCQPLRIQQARRQLLL